MSTAAPQAHPNGRLTEHTVHVDLTNAPELEYKASNGRTGPFTPTKLVIGFQYSWSTRRWVPLYVRALGRRGAADVKVTYPNLGRAPAWVVEIVTASTPPLTLPEGVG
jgi:hypothetical protein